MGCPLVGPLRNEHGKLVAEQCGMAWDFSSIYVANPPANPSEHQSTLAQMEEFSINYDKLLEKLSELDSSSSPGPDGIHPMVLKACAQVLTLPLCLIFRKSLNESVLPDDWKVSRVVPIFKGGSKAIALNYRPVSMTATPCKMMERLLVEHIVEYLEDNQLLSDGKFE